MQHYSLVCQNDSMACTQFCVYQRFKKDTGASSLAWFCQTCYPHARTRFSWSDELYFIWGHAQSLAPGTNLFAAQALAVGQGEQLQLVQRDGIFVFQPAASAAPPGSLMIATDASVPNGVVAVGLGMQGECMCGTAALAVCAGPNSRYFFETETEYYLTSVPSCRLQTGDVLDLNTISAVKIPFTCGRFQITATLNESNAFGFETPKYRMRGFG